jgi:hypothetical protein
MQFITDFFKALYCDIKNIFFKGGIYSSYCTKYPLSNGEGFGHKDLWGNPLGGGRRKRKTLKRKIKK